MAETVMTAAQFVATLGVNVHISQGTVNYANAADDIADLKYLGVANVRDNYNPYWLSTYTALAKAGIKFDFLTVDGGSQSAATIQSFLANVNHVAAAVPGSVAAIEGPNEINNWPLTYSGVSGLQAAVDYQQELYSLVHADSSLSGAKVDYFTGYGVGGVQGPNPATTSGMADYDTQHPYPNNGNPPLQWVNRTQALGNENPATGPAVYTETGYSSNQVGTTIQAKYTLDLLMDTAQQGIAQVDLYELMEEGDGYGLFDASNNPKPVATAIHNLTSILSDSGIGAASIAPAAYTLSGLPADGHSLELTKSNGASDIVVWAEPQISGTASGPAASVTVALGATYKTVEVFDPLQGLAPVQTLSNVSSVTLGVTDHPLIVETEPGATITPPLPPVPSDTLTLRMSQDQWNGDAQFVVLVNNQQVGGVMTASALHGAGDSNVVVLTGNWTTSASVQIQFLNDAYGGTKSTDRNLYVDSIGYNGNNYTGAPMYTNGTDTFAVGGAATATPPADTLTLHLSEDAYQGNADFNLTVDGKQIATPQPVTALHSAGAWEDFTFAGNFGAGSHTIAVTFTNDAYGGTPSTDRNLYVNGIDMNGTHYGSGASALLSTGNTASFTVITPH